MAIPIRPFINAAVQAGKQAAKAFAAEAPDLAAKGVAAALHGHLNKAAAGDTAAGTPAQPSLRNAMARRLLKAMPEQRPVARTQQNATGSDAGQAAATSEAGGAAKGHEQMSQEAMRRAEESVEAAGRMG